MSEQFRVEPGAISELARSFDEEADRLRPLLARFEGAAYSVHDAFGPWGVSHEMLQEYLDTAHQALQGLHDLRRALDHDGERLRAADANYGGAEAGSTYSP
ncbi:MAG: ESX-1 secretion-associated protein [Actinobacteria bacterium]|nr:ESX-1 secretion-associated protein [Actinomycetota bacterium]MBW3651202.1 ESX-1 secretion-associated protein [Actinomycetota bacterium]